MGSCCWWWVVAKMGSLVQGGRGSLLEWVRWSMFIVVGSLVWSGGRLKSGCYCGRGLWVAGNRYGCWWLGVVMKEKDTQRKYKERIKINKERIFQ